MENGAMNRVLIHSARNRKAYLFAFYVLLVGSILAGLIVVAKHDSDISKLKTALTESQEESRLLILQMRQERSLRQVSFQQNTKADVFEKHDKENLPSITAVPFPFKEIVARIDSGKEHVDYIISDYKGKEYSFAIQVLQFYVSQPGLAECSWDGNPPLYLVVPKGTKTGDKLKCVGIFSNYHPTVAKNKWGFLNVRFE